MSQFLKRLGSFSKVEDTNTVEYGDVSVVYAVSKGDVYPLPTGGIMLFDDSSLVTDKYQAITSRGWVVALDIKTVPCRQVFTRDGSTRYKTLEIIVLKYSEEKCMWVEK